MYRKLNIKRQLKFWYCPIAGTFRALPYTLVLVVWFLSILLVTINNLLLSRSGSSVLGELMSLHTSTSYTFEPFRQEAKKEKITCADQYDSTGIADLVESKLMGILNCDPDVVSKLIPFSVRKNTYNCNSTSIRVVKTIRLRLNGVLPWLQKYSSLKVIFLHICLIVQEHIVSRLYTLLEILFFKHNPDSKNPVFDVKKTTYQLIVQDTQVPSNFLLQKELEESQYLSVFLCVCQAQSQQPFMETNKQSVSQ